MNLPTEVMHLWEAYVESERVRVRQDSVTTLQSFIEALTQLPADVTHSWAREFSANVIDKHEQIPVRLPLFRDVLFPALLDGLERSVPGCARWLAGFAQLLHKSPSCSEQLPENQRSEYGLLLRAVQDDPQDASAKKRLLVVMRGHFEYALHELPSGVLYGHDGATIEQCDELLHELADYERLAQETGSETIDSELLATARFHIPAYRRYLLDRKSYASCEQYLSTVQRHDGTK